MDSWNSLLLVHRIQDFAIPNMISKTEQNTIRNNGVRNTFVGMWHFFEWNGCDLKPKWMSEKTFSHFISFKRQNRSDSRRIQMNEVFSFFCSFSNSNQYLCLFDIKMALDDFPFSMAKQNGKESHLNLNFKSFIKDRRVFFPPWTPRLIDVPLKLHNVFTN